MLEENIVQLELSEQVYLKHNEVSDTYYLFCIKNGKHFSLNHTSYDILTLLQEGKDKNEIAKRMSEHYNVDIELCRSDIDELFVFLSKNKFVTK